MITTLLNIFKSLHFWRVWLPPHVGVACGLWYYGGTNVWWTAFTAYVFISGLGVAVGLHRYFSHKSFDTHRFWQQLMLYMGCLACHGNPLFWVALHRGLHHRFADTERDPHSPVTHGWWTAYQGYAFDPSLTKQVPIRAGTDFLRHSSWQWSVKHYHKVLWSTWLVVGAVAYWLDAPWLMIGLCCAQTYAIHQEALVNLVGHTSGFGSYVSHHHTGDKSVNRNWLGWITWGQSLHNNHHHVPNDYDFAQNVTYNKEFDPSVLWINLIRTRSIKS